MSKSNFYYISCNRFKSFIIVAVLLVIFDLSVRGSFPELRFDTFTQEDGLPNNQIQCIFQDSKGWLWIGTSQGISRFDGYTFVNFTHNPADTTSLKGNLVRVIKEDKLGNLLIGTENGDLNVFNYEKEQFTHPLKKSAGYNYRETSVNDIAEDDAGQIYLGTDLNILRMDVSGKVSVLQPHFSSEGETFNGNYIRNLQFDKNGVLWIGTNTGLFTYHPGTNAAEYFPLPFNDDQIKEIWEIYLDDDGIIWVGTYSAGLFLISPDSKTVQSVNLEPAPERTETVRCVSKGIFGEYWIGTRGGLYTYSKQKGVTGFLKQDERDLRSISNNSILSIFNDSQGETWIGTRNGLNLLAKSKQVFHHYGA